MFGRQLLIVVLGLIVVLSLSVGCDGSANIAEDPNPDSQRVVLVELFTYSGEKPCEQAGQALEELADGYGPSKLLLLEYYLSEGLSTVEGFNRFVDYNLEYEVPAVCFNGRVNAVNQWESYEEYKARADSERAKDTPIVITAEKSFSDNKIVVDANVYNAGKSLLSGFEMLFVAYEDTGHLNRRNLVRDIESGPSMFDSLSAGESAPFNITFDIPDCDTSKIEVVVFLQSTSPETREVLQATLAISNEDGALATSGV